MPRDYSSLRRLFGRKAYFSVRTGRRQGTYRQSLFPPKPPDFQGTLPEWNILLAHWQLGLKEDVQFVYLWNAANPNSETRRTQIDFMELDINLGIQIQGFFFHYVGFDGWVIQNDQEKRADLEALGLPIVAIDEEDANADPVYYLRAAREGRDLSRYGRGLV